MHNAKSSSTHKQLEWHLHVTALEAEKQNAAATQIQAVARGRSERQHLAEQVTREGHLYSFRRLHSYRQETKLGCQQWRCDG